VLLVAVCLLLGIGNLVGSPDVANVLINLGAWSGLADSIVVFYLCAALVLNDVRGRALLPIWPLAHPTHG
jgi:succinate-acetate transporter protein